MRTVTSTRLVLDKAEQHVRKTWGNDWNRMRNAEKKDGRVYLLEGTWSGYNASQSRVCHREFLTKKEADAMKLGIISFTDGTTLDISVIGVSIAEILKNHRVKNMGYSSLVRKAVASEKYNYSVSEG